MNEIINAIPEYVITAVVSTAIFYLMNAGKNLLHSKVQHAKTAQSKELWGFIEQVANTAVNSLVSKNLTGDAKFAQATAIVQSALEKQGIKNIDLKAIEAAIQSAYEKSPLTSTISVTKPDSLEQNASIFVPDGTAKAIDPKEDK